MEKVEEMSDRELLEFIYGSQAVMMRKIERIERHLMRETDHETYLSENQHTGEVHQKMVGDVANLFNQIRQELDGD